MSGDVDVDAVVVLGLALGEAAVFFGTDRVTGAFFAATTIAEADVGGSGVGAGAVAAGSSEVVAATEGCGGGGGGAPRTTNAKTRKVKMEKPTAIAAAVIARREKLLVGGRGSTSVAGESEDVDTGRGGTDSGSGA